MHVRKILTLDEVSEIIRVSRNTLRYWRTLSPPQGPPLFKLGRRLVCFEDELVTWVEDRQRETSLVPSVGKA